MRRAQWGKQQVVLIFKSNAINLKNKLVQPDDPT